MTNGLEHLVEEGLVAEVLSRLKSGKEADVYLVRFGGRVVAAKVYKDAAHRSFKNNADYKEGRAVRNTRAQRAIERGSKFGRAAAEDAWKTAEVDALYKLHAAGVRVPTPVMFLEGVLLMELVLDRTGAPAPRLVDVDLDAAQARAGYHDMLAQLVKILCCDLIHGDLSPYNVLWSGQGPTVIDFPQIVSAAHNSRSEAFFRRDARNILGHFAALEPSLRARHSDVDEIWRAYLRRELTPDFLPTGRGPRRPERPAPAPRPAPPARAAGPEPRALSREPRAPRPAQANDARRPAPSPSRGRAPERGPGGHGPPREPIEARRGQPRRPAGPEVIVLARRPSPPPAGAPARDATPAHAPAARPTREAPPAHAGGLTEGSEGAGRRRRRRRRRAPA